MPVTWFVKKPKGWRIIQFTLPVILCECIFTHAGSASYTSLCVRDTWTHHLIPRPPQQFHPQSANGVSIIRRLFIQISMQLCLPLAWHDSSGVRVCMMVPLPQCFRQHSAVAGLDTSLESGTESSLSLGDHVMGGEIWCGGKFKTFVTWQ